MYAFFKGVVCVDFRDQYGSIYTGGLDLVPWLNISLTDCLSNFALQNIHIVIMLKHIQCVIFLAKSELWFFDWESLWIYVFHRSSCLEIDQSFT